MVFEVDNTTKQLIEELQDSIRETIENLQYGQSELKNAVNAIQVVCGGLATSEGLQKIIDEVSGNKDGRPGLAKQLSGVNEEVSKVSKKVEGLSEPIGEMQHLQKQIVETTLEQLRSVSETLSNISVDVDDQLKKLIASAAAAQHAAESNRVMLEAITRYLSLPGYKRFFKGMEAEYFEISQE